MKDELINMTPAWDKEKNLSPQQELNPWPPEHRVGALSTELRELMESKVIYTEFICDWRSARISSAEVMMSGDKWIKMVNFELGN